MNRISASTSIVAISLALAGCKVAPDASNNAADMNAAAADNALDAALNVADENSGQVSPEFLGSLQPPAPGEPGGLPDDRRPLNEGAARAPTSVEASGSVIQLWGMALSQGRYGDAYRLWRDQGKASGMNEAQFTEAYRKYSEINVLTGRPEAGGTATARVPVQMYGRLREDGRPFNLIGMMTLSRNPQGQKNEPGQSPWLIAESDLSPRGTVRVIPAGGEAPVEGAIPQAFRGNWSSSAAKCGKPGDDMRLTVSGDRLTFYESAGKVTSARPLSPNRLRVSATYSGEGETWSDSATLTLSGDGDTLTIGTVTRVRCRT